MTEVYCYGWKHILDMNDPIIIVINIQYNTTILLHKTYKYACSN